MPRSTFPVDRVVEIANRVLAAPETSADFRAGVIGLLEVVLEQTGNYRGFQYLPSEFYNEEDPEPGTEPDPHAPLLRLGYDNSRRRYYSS